jgi:large subunit ribosomal protein L5
MIFINKQYNLRMYEDFCYNQQLDFLTKFNINNNLLQKKINKIVLNFGFKNIKFEKKKMILFFMILELITNQKCVLTSSKKNLIFFRIKKGSIVGCKVTIRNLSLYDFLDNLILALPRSENFEGFFFNLNSNKQNHFSTKIQDLFIFYSLESELLSYIETLDITFSFNTFNDFEKIFLFNYNKIPLKLN